MANLSDTLFPATPRFRSATVHVGLRSELPGGAQVEVVVAARAALPAGRLPRADARARRAARPSPPARPSAVPAVRRWAESRSTAASRRSEEHTSELQSLQRISTAVFCLNKQNKQNR